MSDLQEYLIRIARLPEEEVNSLLRNLHSFESECKHFITLPEKAIFDSLYNIQKESFKQYERAVDLFRAVFLSKLSYYQMTKLKELLEGEANGDYQSKPNSRGCNRKR